MQVWLQAILSRLPKLIDRYYRTPQRNGRTRLSLTNACVEVADIPHLYLSSAPGIGLRAMPHQSQADQYSVIYRIDLNYRRSFLSLLSTASCVSKSSDAFNKCIYGFR